MRFRAAVVWIPLVGLSALELMAGPGSGTLFGTNPTQLIIINRTTGAGATVGPIVLSAPFPSLAVDPTTGFMYAGGGGGAPNVYRVNPATGAGTLVGSSGLGFAAIAAMDFNANGVLYAAVNIFGDGGTGADNLAIINKNTGGATLIGPFGVCTGTPPGGSCTIEGMEGIAFDAAGNLWGSHSVRGSAGAPGLYRINAATGAATFVAPILNGPGGSPPSGGVVSLQFACDGTLYGGTARGFIGGGVQQPGTFRGAGGSQSGAPPNAVNGVDGGRLITINPATGIFAFVGSAFATGGASLAALAFERGCGCPPHRIHGHISTELPTHSGTFHEHHGVHGHLVAANCPPHAPGHSILSSDREETFLRDAAPAAVPAIFVAAINADGTFNDGTHPAPRGAIVQLRGSAEGFFLGEQDALPASNFAPPASGSPLYFTSRLPEARVGGVKATVVFSGLAPGVAGVWQINIVIPNEVSPGAAPVTILYEGEELKGPHIVVAVTED